MVAKMRSRESTNSSPSRQAFECDLNLPVFEEPLMEPWPVNMSWLQAMRHLARTRGYVRNFESPQDRLRGKNPTPFVLP